MGGSTVGFGVGVTVAVAVGAKARTVATTVGVAVGVGVVVEVDVGVGVGGAVAVGVPVKVGRATATATGGGVTAAAGVSKCGTKGKTTSPSAVPKMTLRIVVFQREWKRAGFWPQVGHTLSPSVTDLPHARQRTLRRLPLAMRRLAAGEESTDNAAHIVDADDDHQNQQDRHAHDVNHAFLLWRDPLATADGVLIGIHALVRRDMT